MRLLIKLFSFKEKKNVVYFPLKYFLNVYKVLLYLLIQRKYYEDLTALQ